MGRIVCGDCRRGTIFGWLIENSIRIDGCAMNTICWVHVHRGRFSTTRNDILLFIMNSFKTINLFDMKRYFEAHANWYAVQVRAPVHMRAIVKVQSKMGMNRNACKKEIPHENCVCCGCRRTAKHRRNIQFEFARQWQWTATDRWRWCRSQSFRFASTANDSRAARSKNEIEANERYIIIYALLRFCCLVHSEWPWPFRRNPIHNVCKTQSISETKSLLLFPTHYSYRLVSHIRCGCHCCWLRCACAKWWVRERVTLSHSFHWTGANCIRTKNTNNRRNHHYPKWQSFRMLLFPQPASEFHFLDCWFRRSVFNFSHHLFTNTLNEENSCVRSIIHNKTDRRQMSWRGRAIVYSSITIEKKHAIFLSLPIVSTIRIAMRLSCTFRLPM